MAAYEPVVVRGRGTETLEVVSLAKFVACGARESSGSDVSNPVNEGKSATVAECNVVE